MDEVKTLTTSRRDLSIDRQIVLGVMWQLNLREGNINTVNVDRPFDLSLMMDEWNTFSQQYMGPTLLTEEQIQSEGIAVFLDVY